MQIFPLTRNKFIFGFCGRFMADLIWTMFFEMILKCDSWICTSLSWLHLFMVVWFLARAYFCYCQSCFKKVIKNDSEMIISIQFSKSLIHAVGGTIAKYRTRSAIVTVLKSERLFAERWTNSPRTPESNGSHGKVSIHIFVFDYFERSFIAAVSNVSKTFATNVATGVNFTNVLHAAFTYISQLFWTYILGLYFTGTRLLAEKVRVDIGEIGSRSFFVAAISSTSGASSGRIFFSYFYQFPRKFNPIILVKCHKYWI